MNNNMTIYSSNYLVIFFIIEIEVIDILLNLFQS
jgi:hypothetical protein